MHHRPQTYLDYGDVIINAKTFPRVTWSRLWLNVSKAYWVQFNLGAPQKWAPNACIHLFLIYSRVCIEILDTYLARCLFLVPLHVRFWVLKFIGQYECIHRMQQRNLGDPLTCFWIILPFACAEWRMRIQWRRRTMQRTAVGERNGLFLGGGGWRLGAVI